MLEENFKRIEKKYLLNLEQYQKIMDIINLNFSEDEHGRSTILNLYFDTDDFLLIKKSLQKPIYKEKLRLRCYKTPKLDTSVFFEIKKKYKGEVSKRRIKLSLKNFYDYINHNLYEKDYNSQVFDEIDYMIKRYNLIPKVFIGYDRKAYFEKNNNNLRVTFDFNLRYRQEDIFLENGDAGKLILNKGECIMEIKSDRNLPFYFVKDLSNLKIFPTSFSKYGSVYKKIMEGYNV